MALGFIASSRGKLFDDVYLRLRIVDHTNFRRRLLSGRGASGGGLDDGSLLTPASGEVTRLAAPLPTSRAAGGAAVPGVNRRDETAGCEMSTLRPADGYLSSMLQYSREASLANGSNANPNSRV